MNNRTITTYVLVAICVVLLVGVVWFLHVMANPSDTLENQLARVKKCMDQKYAIPCARAGIKVMLDTHSGAEVMEAVETHIPALRCHYVGHLVGQDLYRRTNDVEDALSQCSRVCDAACVDGVVGEAFADHLGLGSSDTSEQVDLAHLSESDLSTIGRKLCTSATTCHGVGHALFQTTKTLPNAMQACKTIVTNATSSNCYFGAAMEYSDQLVFRSMREMPSMTLPSTSTLSTLCNLPLLEQRRACFQYFARTAIETFQARGLAQRDAFNQTRELCRAQQSTEDRIACFYGFGRFNSYLIATNIDSAHRWCESEPNERDVAACYFGEISTAARDREEQLVNYCSTMSSDKFRTACYLELAYLLNTSTESIKNAVQYCEGEDASCERSFKQPTIDPWDYIHKNFRL